jgi:signal transduction histidine kinase
MNPDSTGLGLSIAKKIADINKATIELVNNKEKGSTVTVTMEPFKN